MKSTHTERGNPMRVERTSAISSALPSPEYQAIGQRTRSPASSHEDAEATASRTLSDIAQQFDMRDMDPAEALQLAERLMQEELLTPAAYSCLTGVPMTRVPGKGCQPRRTFDGRELRYDYIGEFESYVAFDSAAENAAGVNLLQSVLNTLCSLDALRRNGPLNLSA
jgi:hypothetical protein